MKAIVGEYIRDSPLGYVALSDKLHDARIESEMKKCIKDENTGCLF